MTFPLGLEWCEKANAQAPTSPLAVADLAIEGVTLIDVEHESVVEDSVIVITGERLTEVGPRSKVKARARRRIDGAGLIALPGFVNTHTHLWQHAARSVQPSGQLQEWARSIYSIAPHASADDVRQITQAAAGQALLNGITTLADFTSINYQDGNIEATLDVLRKARIGGAVVLWRPAAFLPSELLDAQIDRLKMVAGDRHQIWVGFGPLSFFSLPAAYDGMLAARRGRLRMSEHSMENLQEAREFRRRMEQYLATVQRRGLKLAESDRVILEGIAGLPEISKVDLFEAMSRSAGDILDSASWAQELSPGERQSLGALPARTVPSPVGLLDHLGVLSEFVAIHSVWPNREDLGLFRKNGVAVSHNPESNMYLASGVSPLRAYRDAGVRVTLGTDGAASNDRISMFDAMRTAALLQKISALNSSVTAGLSSWFYIKAATIDGAVALGIGDRTGSLSRGKEADVILLDAKRLSLAPLLRGSNDVALLINSAEARDIAYVIADGKIVVEHGKLLTWDEGQLAVRLSEIGKTLATKAASGRHWQERLVLTEKEIRQPWWRYGSVRKNDTLDLMVANKSNAPLKLAIAFSGTTFGGTVSQLFHRDTVARFPAEKSASFWTTSAEVKSGEVVGIHRKAGSTQYQITIGANVVKHEGREAEQVLLFVAPAVNLE